MRKHSNGYGDTGTVSFPSQCSEITQHGIPSDNKCKGRLGAFAPRDTRNAADLRRLFDSINCTDR